LNITEEEYRDAFKSAYAAAYNVLHNNSDAEDAAQEAIFLYSKKGSVIDSINFWVYRVSKNIAITKVRRENRRRRREEEYCKINDYYDKPLPSIQKLLSSLSEQDRELTMDYFYRNMAQADISQKHGVNQATISRRLIRILYQLRKRIKIHDFL